MMKRCSASFASVVISILALFCNCASNVGGAVFPCGRPSNSTPLTGPGILSQIDIPWSVTITTRAESRLDATFPAVLISPSLALASAHYLLEKGTHGFHIFPPSTYVASLATRKGGDPIHSDPNAVMVSLKHIQIHPEYKEGNWTHWLNDYALFHLSEPVHDARVEPICLPSSDDEALITELRSPTLSQTEEELVVTGWNRNIDENLFLRLKTQSFSTCDNLWQNNNETRPNPYRNKWCAVIGEQNTHWTCIHMDVGGVRMINGSYYFSGIVDNFYSTNASRKCYSGAEYYFRNLNKNTLYWIENNLRCGPDNFTCGSGECISLLEVCDQSEQCKDGSDEEQNYCRGRDYCTVDEFACGVYGRCIPQGEYCDGVVNCEHGEDEENCVKNEIPIAIVTGITLTFLTIAVTIILLWRRNVNHLKKKIRDLTQNEVNDFLLGCPPQKYSVKKKGELSYNYTPDPIQSQPWNTSHTIASGDIKIKEEINRGNFGIIYKATLLNNKSVTTKVDRVEEEVAVKTNLKTVGVQDFKILLSELKILAYVGEHANVLRFVGACTENIKQREVYLVVEYCQNGNLYDYLIKNAKYFMHNESMDSICDHPAAKITSDYQFDNSQYGFLNLYDLILWSTQIAAGMEYLASKRIAHGDLATRNLLLSSNLDIKISDFGLSRQLGYSGVYIKSADEPAPWKWLAIESLISHCVSEKSDVWSFGVTIWEIFTLGETPYGDDSRYNAAFIENLVSGHRLQHPKLASNEIYEIMSNCWKPCATDRPTFCELRDELITILHTCSGCSKRSSGSSDCKEAQLNYMTVLDI